MEKKSIEVGFLLVFPIFFLEKAFADELFMCILQRMAQNTFLACKVIVHILLPEHKHDRFLKKLKKKWQCPAKTRTRYRWKRRQHGQSCAASL